MKKLFAVALAAFWIFPIAAAPLWADESLSAYASVDKSSVLVGDRITFTLSVSHKKDIIVPPPVFKDGKIGDFQIKDSGRRTKKGIFSGERDLYWYSISSFATGKHLIPEIEIKYKLKSGKDWLIAKTKPLKVNVESILPQKLPADIKDVKPPAGFFEIWPILLALAVILALIAAGFLIYRLTRKPAPPKLPHEVALESLARLRAQFMRTSDPKEYFAGVSDAIRRYIEATFRLKAPEMTTEEFLVSLKESTALTAEQKDLMKNFLNACDLVKFAKYTPGWTESESVYMSAKKFVDETKIQFLPAEDAGKKRKR